MVVLGNWVYGHVLRCRALVRERDMWRNLVLVTLVTRVAAWQVPAIYGPARLQRRAQIRSCAVRCSADDDRPWWWPRVDPNWVWPPRVDEPSLVLGDVVAIFAAASALESATPAWVGEGSAMACAWLVGAAVTNAWDDTATLPSLGLINAVKCVARASVDFASTRVVFALVQAFLAQQPVDIPLLATEVVLTALVLAVWRAAFTSTRIYF